MDKLRELIRQAIAEILDEENATSGGEAYSTPFAFSKGGKNRATKTAEKLGFELVSKQPKSGKTFEFVKYESLINDLVNERLYILTPNAFGKINHAALTQFGMEEATDTNIKKSSYKDEQEIIGKDIVNEVSYRSFSKSISEMSPERKMSNAIRGINKRLKEIDQLTDYTLRLREENNLKTENKLSNSIKGLEAMTERLAVLNKKIKTLKK
jgi:hypothetical protein